MAYVQDVQATVASGNIGIVIRYSDIKNFAGRPVQAGLNRARRL